jgi:hypothetical protein
MSCFSFWLWAFGSLGGDVCLFIVIETVPAISPARHCEERSNLIFELHALSINRRHELPLTYFLP